MGWQSELIRDKRTANKLFCCREMLTGFAAWEQLSMNNPHICCKQCSNYNLYWIYIENPLFLCLSFVTWHRPAVFALRVHRLLYLTFRGAWYHVAEEPDVRADVFFLFFFVVAAVHNMPFALLSVGKHLFVLLLLSCLSKCIVKSNVNASDK